VIPFLAGSLWAQPAGGAAAQDSQGTAATQTIKVAAHSSRWDYPTEASPASGQQVHFVEKGDTLWDLGAKYLGNPFAWPQIWELNKWVKDPHWIYPGDPILVEPSRGAVPQQQGQQQSLAPREVADLQPDLRRVVKPTQEEYGYAFQDFVQMPYLVSPTAEAYFKQVGAIRVVGQEDKTKAMLGDGDTVYLGAGSSQGVKVGDRLVLTKIVARKFYHPDDTRRRTVLGDILEQGALVRVTTVYPDQSVALIERSLDGIDAGSFAVPYMEPPNIVSSVRRDIASPVAVRQPVLKIIYIRMNKMVAAGGDLVIIDGGSSQGFKVGDILLSARPVPLDASGSEAAQGAKTDIYGNIAAPRPGVPMTNYYLGQVMVIRTGERTSTCRILRSIAEFEVGDLLTR
jgi:hypothetical protein